jgi:hypothetical protein
MHSISNEANERKCNLMDQCLNECWIDVANGNVRRVTELGKTIKEPDVILMVGNIKQPRDVSYCEMWVWLQMFGWIG